jgi:ribosomal protein S18 acetylase RimI-like enzyme
MNYTFVKFSTVEAMLCSLQLIKELTAEVTLESYKNMLSEMVPHNYHQVAVYDGNILIGVSGYWIATKIYCGKYLEIDNLVIANEYRSKNIGKQLVDWMTEEAKMNNCTTILLDAYVENFKAHKFYYREGFIARGFHYLKKLN